MRTMSDILQGMDESEFIIKCTNFKFFAERVIGFSIQPFHMEWINMIMNNRRVAIEAPTGFGKTAILGEAFCLWTSYTQKEKEMCIVSKTLNQATKILGNIKDRIENNEMLLELIPQDKPAGHWCSATTMVLSTNCKIFCRPYSENIKGIHVDYLLGDEVASYDDYAIWHRFVVTRTNAKNGVVVAISTSDNIADLMQELLVNPEYVGKVYKAIDDDGKSIWPENWSLEKLNKIRSEIGEAAFQREYLNNPRAEAENALFPPHLITECFDNTLKFTMKPLSGFTVIGCDFAIASGPRADYDAYVVLNKVGNLSQLVHGETHRGFSIAAKMMRLKELYNTYSPRLKEKTDEKGDEIPSTIRFVIDPSNVGQAVYEQLRAEGYPVEGAKFDSYSRNQMLINLRQMIENKELIIPRNSEDTATITFTDKLIKEMISMVETKTKMSITYMVKCAHDDTIMALAMACKGVIAQKGYTDMFAF